MGQTSSDCYVQDIADGIRQQTSMLKEMVSVTYEEFLAKVQELNQISQSYNDSKGTQLMFVIKKGSDSSILWKNTVRIGCLRVETDSRKILNHKLLKLNQFLRLYHVLINHVSASTTSAGASSYQEHDNDETAVMSCMSLKVRDISASFIFHKLDVLEDADSDLSECCICMERKPEVTLPCAHSYCLPCIEQWNVTNKTCPICREDLPSTDDSWVISEAPNSEEVDAELRKALAGVTGDKGT